VARVGQIILNRITKRHETKAIEIDGDKRRLWTSRQCKHIEPTNEAKQTNQQLPICM
jgi:hypothetical protein